MINRCFNLGFNEIEESAKFREERKHVELWLWNEIEALANVKVDYNLPPAEKEFMNKFAKTIIYYKVHVGDRYDETVRLKWKDIFENPSRVYINSNKTGKDRVVVIPQSVLLMLNELPKKGEFVFVMPSGSVVTNQWLNTDLKRRAALVGLKKNIDTHSLRYAHINMCHKAHFPLAVTMQRVEHTDSKTTLRYTLEDLDMQLKYISQLPVAKEKQRVEEIVDMVTKYVEEIVNKERIAVDTHQISSIFKSKYVA